MNITSPLKTTMKLALLTSLTAVFAGSAMAGELASSTAPQFGVVSNATGSIGAAATAFERGDYAKSITFSRYALKQGLKKSRKATTYSNLCAALGAQGNFGEALTACNSALEIAPQNWQAYENRATVHWLSGNQEAAKVDMATASKKSL